MDTLPDYEFIEIFDRVSQDVRFGRSYSLKVVKKRMRRILRLQKQASQIARKQSTRRMFRTRYRFLRTLYRHGFPERVWEEAVRNPGGIIDLTLDYGREKARKIKLERERSRFGRLRRYRR